MQRANQSPGSPAWCQTVRRKTSLRRSGSVQCDGDDEHLQHSWNGPHRGTWATEGPWQNGPGRFAPTDSPRQHGKSGTDCCLHRKQRKRRFRQGYGERAGEGTRTLDNHVGNVVLYQLSYTRSRNTELQVRYSESGIMRYQLFASTSLLKNCTVENPGGPEDRVGINAENFIEFAAEEGKLA